MSAAAEEEVTFKGASQSKKSAQLQAYMEKKRAERLEWLTRMEELARQKERESTPIMADLADLNRLADALERKLREGATPRSSSLSETGPAADQHTPAYLTSLNYTSSYSPGAQRAAGADAAAYGAAGASGSGNASKTEQDLLEIKARLQRERDRIVREEEEARRAHEAAVLEAQRKEEEARRKYEEEVRKREAMRRDLEAERQRQEEEDRHVDELGQKKLAHAVRRLDKAPVNTEYNPMVKNYSTETEEQRRRRLEREEEERRKEDEARRRHEIARVVVNNALTTETDADPYANRAWIKDLNEYASNADTIKKKVNNTSNAEMLTFREKMIKFAAAQQEGGAAST